MAGIGVRLNRIFEKNTLTTNLVGFFYSTVVTVAPMFVIIINLILMEYLLDFASVGYVTRELFSCTILYTFIFSLLTASPFNAVLSRYMSDVIYEERYQDILPCYHIGMLLNIGLSCLLGIPFCLWEHFVGKVPTAYVFCGFCGYISLVLVFYSMIYLSICKDYQRISQYFFFGMLVAFVLALILHFILKWETTWSMLFSLTIGFFVTATLENALIRRYFVRNSNHYRPVLQYFRKYWKLIFTNFLYILGLYIHNFVFWTTDMRMEIAKSFVCNQPYDMASCLAMFTNISATIIFIAREAQLPGGFSDSYTGIRILTVGRLAYQKAYDIAIPAMKKIREDGYEARWYVLGEGSERNALEKQIAELGLQEDFQLPGAKENLFPYYAQCDLYVHATRFEGKSIAIQEAQTLGCAVIASDCAGNREQIVDGEDGLLCTLTPEGIAEKVEELLDDPKKRERLAAAAKQKMNGQTEEIWKLLNLMK